MTKEQLFDQVFSFCLDMKESSSIDFLDSDSSYASAYYEGRFDAYRSVLNFLTRCANE